MLHWRYFIILTLFSACPWSATADDWPQFGRNQSRNPVSPEKNPPVWWHAEEQSGKNDPKTNKNVRWSAHISNGGYGQIYGDPVIVDGLVWVGACVGINLGKANPTDEEDRWESGSGLICLDEKTGKELYRHVSRRPPGTFEAGGISHGHSSSPYIEGDRLWVVTNRCEVVCLDIGALKKRQGQPRELWKLDMRKDLGVRARVALHDNRRCSVAAYKDWLYVITGNGVVWEDKGRVLVDQAPSLICLEKATGKVVWKDNSPGKNILFGQFASPTVIEAKGQAQVLAPQGDGWLRSFDPATGKLLWQFDTNPHDAISADPKYLNEADGTRNHLPATAVFYEGRVYIGNGRNSEVGSGAAWLYCIDPTKSGDISPEFTNGPNKGKPNPNSGTVWKYGGVDQEAKPDKGGFKPDLFERTLSNVAIDKGLLIACSVEGMVYCLDAKAGRLYWSHPTKTRITGNPLIVDGKVYVAEDDENFHIFELGKEKKIIARIEQESYMMCSPVFANGVLYVTSRHYLYAIAGNEKPPAK